MSCKLIRNNGKVTGVINEFGETEPYFNAVLNDIIKKGVTNPSLSQDELAARYTEVAMDNRASMKTNVAGNMIYDPQILENVKFSFYR